MDDDQKLLVGVMVVVLLFLSFALGNIIGVADTTFVVTKDLTKLTWQDDITKDDIIKLINEYDK